MILFLNKSAKINDIEKLRDRLRFMGFESLIDIENNQVNVELTDEKLSERKKRLKPKEIKYKDGVLAKYAKLVNSASNGAVTD